jgi:hypothetical protein
MFFQPYLGWLRAKSEFFELSGFWVFYFFIFYTYDKLQQRFWMHQWEDLSRVLDYPRSWATQVLYPTSELSV